MTRTHSASCLCGTVAVTLHGEPAARANGHCATGCDCYGTPMRPATAWPPEQVAVEGGHATFPHPAKPMSRTCCASCGEFVFGTHRPGMRVVPNSWPRVRTAGSCPAACNRRCTCSTGTA
ncbi:hypothetical protein LMG29660_06299 [Burkholderia puraquae]|uniref:CENP-V/GFA domain-containing protein n=1 Tax=Burkholderia puraquae TaxID=1904757 RepID=A0A6J5ESR8_9BURK|nr:hypothetical protein LMG29660_06299 [Burkholderia puraquae]